MTWVTDPPPGQYEVLVRLYNRFELPERDIPFTVVVRGNGPKPQEFNGPVTQHHLFRFNAISRRERSAQARQNRAGRLARRSRRGFGLTVLMAAAVSIVAAACGGSAGNALDQCRISAFGDINVEPCHVCFGRQSGHRDFKGPCPLLTQSGHRQLEVAAVQTDA